MADNFALHMGHINDELTALQADFDTLTPSDYKDGAYRLRRYSKFDFNADDLTINVQQGVTFSQDDSINNFQGNVARTYDDLSDKVQANPAFLKMCQALVEHSDLPSQCVLEAHQMRIIAKPEVGVAESAPEGIHQDGFDYVAVFTVARHNEQGGDLCVWRDKNAPSPILSTTPKSGEYYIINDHTLWHSATPLSPMDKSQQAYWDLFVITAILPNK